MLSRIWEVWQTGKQVPDYGHDSLCFLGGPDFVCHLAKLPTTVLSTKQAGICGLYWRGAECCLGFSLFSPKCFSSPTWGPTHVKKTCPQQAATFLPCALQPEPLFLGFLEGKRTLALAPNQTQTPWERGGACMWGAYMRQSGLY